MTPRLIRRIGVVTAAGLALLLSIISPAFAHVTVGSNDAVPGGYSQLSFRVPTESDTSATTKLAVEFPEAQPLAFTAVRPHPGWTYRIDRRELAVPLVDDDGAKVTEAVGQIEWTAAGADSAIKPGEYDEFVVVVGPLPKAGSLVFKAVQTYSDGRVVRWIDTAAPGEAEPSHPAPVLALNTGVTPLASTTPISEDTSPIIWWAFAVGAVAVVLSAGAVGLSIRRRRTDAG